MTRGGAIRERRIGLGLPQWQVGVMAGVSQGEVSRAERDKAVERVYRRVEEALGAEMIKAGVEFVNATEERLARQEAIWAAVPESPEKDALKTAMLDRAYDLMCESSGEEADALCEFLPRADVIAMLDRWYAEQVEPIEPSEAKTADCAASHSTLAESDSGSAHPEPARP